MEIVEFQEKLRHLVTFAQEKNKNITQEEILEIFGEGQLSREQLQSLYQYLKIQGISIAGVDISKTDLEREIARVSAKGEKETTDAENGRQEEKANMAAGAKPAAGNTNGFAGLDLDEEDENFLREMKKLVQDFRPEIGRASCRERV